MRCTQYAIFIHLIAARMCVCLCILFVYEGICIWYALRTCYSEWCYWVLWPLRRTTICFVGDDSIKIKLFIGIEIWRQWIPFPADLPGKGILWSNQNQPSTFIAPLPTSSLPKTKEVWKYFSIDCESLFSAFFHSLLFRGGKSRKQWWGKV